MFLVHTGQWLNARSQLMEACPCTGDTAARSCTHGVVPPCTRRPTHQPMASYSWYSSTLLAYMGSCASAETRSRSRTTRAPPRGPSPSPDPAGAAAGAGVAVPNAPAAAPPPPPPGAADAGAAEGCACGADCGADAPLGPGAAGSPVGFRGSAAPLEAPAALAGAAVAFLLLPHFSHFCGPDDSAVRAVLSAAARFALSWMSRVSCGAGKLGQRRCKNRHALGAALVPLPGCRCSTCNLTSRCAVCTLRLTYVTALAKARSDSFGEGIRQLARISYSCSMPICFCATCIA